MLWNFKRFYKNNVLELSLVSFIFIVVFSALWLFKNVLFTTNGRCERSVQPSCVNAAIAFKLTGRLRSDSVLYRFSAGDKGTKIIAFGDPQSDFFLIDPGQSRLLMRGKSAQFDRLAGLKPNDHDFSALERVQAAFNNQDVLAIYQAAHGFLIRERNKKTIYIDQYARFVITGTLITPTTKQLDQSPGLRLITDLRNSPKPKISSKARKRVVQPVRDKEKPTSSDDQIASIQQQALKADLFPQAQPKATATMQSVSRPVEKVNKTVSVFALDSKGSPPSATLVKSRVAAIFKRLPMNFSVNFKAPKERYQIAVFTDPSCPFCQVLHEYLHGLLAEGITVRYLFYPRKGLKDDIVGDMVNAWCAPDQATATEFLYANRRSEKTYRCNALDPKLKRLSPPIVEHYQLGEIMGIKGTPTILSQDGDILSGFNKKAGIEGLLAKFGLKSVR